MPDPGAKNRDTKSYFESTGRPVTMTAADRQLSESRMFGFQASDDVFVCDLHKVVGAIVTDELAAICMPARPIAHPVDERLSPVAPEN